MHQSARPRSARIPENPFRTRSLSENKSGARFHLPWNSFFSIYQSHFSAVRMFFYPLRSLSTYWPPDGWPADGQHSAVDLWAKVQLFRAFVRAQMAVAHDLEKENTNSSLFLCETENWHFQREKKMHFLCLHFHNKPAAKYGSADSRFFFSLFFIDRFGLFESDSIGVILVWNWENNAFSQFSFTELSKFFKQNLGDFFSDSQIENLNWVSAPL